MKKRALLIGMNKYISTSELTICDLPATQFDVYTLERRLKQLSFETESYLDISHSDMESIIFNFAEHAPCDSLNIIYFSGHGGHYLGENLLYPIDFALNISKRKSIDKSAYNIKNISSLFKRDVKLLIIIDACRNGLTEAYNNNYSELFAPKNTYISYSTLFDSSAMCSEKISYFTEALCENILTPNISIDQLFVNVRSALFQKYSKQIANSVNGLMEDVYLNYKNKCDEVGNTVYNFVKDFGDMYVDKYGVFAGDDLVFIDAAQYCDISLLDAIYKYRIIDREKCNIHLNITEFEEKLIALWGMIENGLYQDEFYTWNYHGRSIRLGEIPARPYDMQLPRPDYKEEIKVQIEVEVQDSMIRILTNLPDGMQLYGKLNNKYPFNNINVSNGVAVIPILVNNFVLENILIQSVAVTQSKVDISIVGDKGRNLIGRYIKFHPIYGNQLYYYSSI